MFTLTKTLSTLFHPLKWNFHATEMEQTLSNNKKNDLYPTKWNKQYPTTKWNKFLPDKMEQFKKT